MSVWYLATTSAFLEYVYVCLVLGYNLHRRNKMILLSKELLTNNLSIPRRQKQIESISPFQPIDYGNGKWIIKCHISDSLIIDISIHLPPSFPHAAPTITCHAPYSSGLTHVLIDKNVCCFKHAALLIYSLLCSSLVNYFMEI
jgi:hypothetical protein